MRGADLLAPDKNKSYSAFVRRTAIITIAVNSPSVTRTLSINGLHPCWDHDMVVAIVTAPNIGNWKRVMASLPNNLVGFWMS